MILETQKLVSLGMKDPEDDEDNKVDHPHL